MIVSLVTATLLSTQTRYLDQPAPGAEDRIGTAIWYARQTKEQVDKLGEKIDALTEYSGDTRARADRLQDRVERSEHELGILMATVKSLELWRSESLGKLAAFGSIFAVVMGYATSTFNRWRAKADKRKGEE